MAFARPQVLSGKTPSIYSLKLHMESHIRQIQEKQSFSSHLKPKAIDNGEN